MVSSRMLHVSPCVRFTGRPNAPVQWRRACASAELSAKLDAVSTPTPAAESAAHRLRLRNLETPARCRAQALRRLRPPSEGGDSTFHEQPRTNQKRSRQRIVEHGDRLVECNPVLLEGPPRLVAIPLKLHGVPLAATTFGVLTRAVSGRS